ncbi:HIG1 domain family member 2A (Partial), partial [Seminavis robusta]
MGSSQSHPSWQQSRYITRMEASPQTSALQPTSSAATPDAALTKGDEPPPQLYRVESFSDKFIRKFSSQPLVPIGCVATAYFLASGIKSFRDRDPIRSQKMMRARVGAQFVTIMIFIG